jgi:cyclic pyranopterin phosphate synthase
MGGAVGRSLPLLAESPLADAQGRRITYLRLSLTDRCNFHCSYCSPLGPDEHEDPLTRAEAARLVSIFARLGVRRVRLTGGEPTLRRDLVEVVGDVAATPGIEEVALTTNGLFLDRLAAPLKAAGLSKLNVSIDTLRPDRLMALSGRAASLARVVAGIEAAAAAGYQGLKLNVVVMQGVNEDELGALARFAWRHGATPRFIELMPFGEGTPVPVAGIRALLEAQGVRLSPDGSRGWGPATHLRGDAEDGGRPVGGLVGFIGAMTENFCDGCNRVRVAANGTLRACLGGRERVSLKGLLRDGGSDETVAAAVVEALRLKRDRHHMAEEAGGLLPMVGTGG